MEFNTFAQFENPCFSIVCFEAFRQFGYQLSVAVYLSQMVGKHISSVL